MIRARVLAIVLVVAAFLLVAPGLARGDGPERPARQVTYVVEPGDTLWSIAERIGPAGDVRVLVDRLADANGRAALEAGQRLDLTDVLGGR